jgi:hypothetical protein
MSLCNPFHQPDTSRCQKPQYRGSDNHHNTKRWAPIFVSHQRFCSDRDEMLSPDIVDIFFWLQPPPLISSVWLYVHHAMV